VPISETARHDMLIALEGAIGKEAAMTMAEHLPPVGWADVATKQDLAPLRHDIVSVRQDMATLEDRLTTRMELLERELHRFSTDIRREMHDGQRTLFFAILAAFVANTGIVLSVIQSID